MCTKCFDNKSKQCRILKCIRECRTIDVINAIWIFEMGVNLQCAEPVSIILIIYIFHMSPDAIANEMIWCVHWWEYTQSIPSFIVNVVRDLNVFYWKRLADQTIVDLVLDFWNKITFAKPWPYMEWYRMDGHTISLSFTLLSFSIYNTIFYICIQNWKYFICLITCSIENEFATLVL